jgi:hypothetical protein
MRWDQLTRPEQLNEQCDQGAKQAILEADRQVMGRPRPLPLEAVTVYIGDEKMTTDTGDRLRFLGNLPNAEKHFARRKILLPDAFAQVDWTNVHVALHEVPRGFQLWACKQVNNLAATNARFHKLDSSHSPLCPSCLNEPETCAHVLMCEQEDRVKCFLRSVENLRTWLEAVGTNPWLTESICSFAQSRNSQSFGQCVECYHDTRMDRLARSQDKIGWRRFMEGMISKEFCKIQDVHGGLYGTIPGNKWAQCLVTKLLEITHGQWLVRNFLIHDEVSGMLALERKEDLQIAIEEQIEMGVRGLDDEDKYLMEIKLEDLETTRGESQAYWLLAVQSARKAHTLRRRQQPRRNSQTTTDRVG